jgi:hypothetical protein
LHININNRRMVVLDGSDARNLGLKCCVCAGSQVVYHISRPAGTFRAGSYCYPCLLLRCRENKRIPYPIESLLLQKLQYDLSDGNRKIIINLGGI